MPRASRMPACPGDRCHHTAQPGHSELSQQRQLKSPSVLVYFGELLRDYLLERHEQSFHPLAHSSDAQKGWVSCIRFLVPGASNSVWVSPVGASYLSRHCDLLPESAVMGSWSQEPEQGLEPRPPDTRTRVSWRAACPLGHANTCSCFIVVTSEPVSVH